MSVPPAELANADTSLLSSFFLLSVFCSESDCLKSSSRFSCACACIRSSRSCSVVHSHGFFISGLYQKATRFFQQGRVRPLHRLVTVIGRLGSSESLAY